MSYRRLSVAMIGSPYRAPVVAGRRSSAAAARHFARAGVAIVGTAHTLKEGLVRTITYFERLLTEEGVGALA
jgi:hypothetical protein